MSIDLSEFDRNHLGSVRYLFEQIDEIQKDIISVESGKFDVQIHGRYLGDKLDDKHRNVIKNILIEHSKHHLNVIRQELEAYGIQFKKP